MTIDERKMAIAYGDLLCIQDLIQHIMRMDAHELMGEDARKAFAAIAYKMDVVAADMGHWMSTHTDFNDKEEKKR